MMATARRRSQRSKTAPKRRLAFEPLEIRTLLAVGLHDTLIDLRLVPVALPSPADTAAELPAALSEVAGPDTAFFAEIWVRNADGSPHGIVGGYLDVCYDAHRARATGVEHGAIYTEMALGTIDAAADKVDDVGGVAAPGVTDLGDNEWVRMAVVALQSTAAGTLTLSARPGTDTLARAGEGEIAWSNVALPSATLTITHGDPTTPGLYDPSSGVFYLRDENSTGPAHVAFGFGDPTQHWTPLTGDWDGNTGDTIGFYDPQGGLWYLRNSLSTGYADVTFGYGAPQQGWLPLVGDWDGTAGDTVGLFDPASCVWYLRNALSTGYADATFGYGAPGAGWQAVVGDWDGDGLDTIGFYDPETSVWYLRNSLTTGYADWTFGFGAAQSGWQPIVGDWDGDGLDSIGFYDPESSLFYLRNSLSTGYADVTFGFGAAGLGWQPLVGSWRVDVKLDGDPSTLAAAQWIDFDSSDGLADGAAPLVVIEHSGAGLTGHVTLPGAWLEPVTIGEWTLARLSVPELATTDAVGRPELPLVRTLLAVPDGATVVAELSGPEQEISLADLGVDLQVAPRQEPVPKVFGARERMRLALDRWAYVADRFEPVEGLRVIPAGRRGDEQLMVVEVRPVSYNPVERTFKIRTELDFRVEVSGGAKPAEAGATLAAATAAGRLLVIAHQDFAASLAAFVTFKTSQGWVVDVADTQTAGTTATAIRGYIQGRYVSPSTRPDAVLLVGDSDRIPCFTGVGADQPATDLYYACMDGGDDWYPDLAIGRFSVANTTQLADVIEKTIAYETSPGGAWKTQAAFLAGNDNYQITEGTHDWVIAQYLDPRGYSSDKLYEVSSGATTQDVRNALNDGRVLAVYSGHGSETSWADGPAFTQSDVRGLANDGLYPFVASFACLTGRFTLSECFAETWLRAAGKGAVDVFASSVTSYWIEDDILERKLFSAIYDEGQASFGAATRRAKELYLEYFGPAGDTRRYFEMYNLLGDPTVSLTGLNLAITTPAETPAGYRNEPYQLSLRAASGTEPYRWSVTAGQLPAGLHLDANTGVISGTPTALADARFTVTVTDATSASDSRELHLVVIDRLAITTASPLPSGTVGAAYSVTLQATGGTAPYTWSVAGAGDYREDAGTTHWLGGGTAQGWRADDASWLLDLPFSFPFYDGRYDSVHVCSNGFVDFVSGSTAYSNSDAELKGNARIAPLWDDIVTTGAGEDIYVTSTANDLAIRWEGRTYSTGQPVKVELVLHRDGTIDFNYGAAHAGLSPTIGVSSGDGSRFTLSARNGAATIAAGAGSRFSPAQELPPGLSLSPSGTLSGTPGAAGSYAFELQATDAGAVQQTAVKSFALDVGGTAPLSLTLPASVTEGAGTLAGAGSVSVPSAVAADLVVTLQWAAGSEVSSAGTATILAGHSSAAFDLIVGDDALLDGTQVSSLSAAAAGWLGASALLPVHDNETTTITMTLPGAVTEGAPSAAGTLFLAAAPARDVQVWLESSDTSELVAPTFVLVAAGATSAPFSLAVVDDTVIDGLQSVQISASVAGWTGATNTVNVQDNDATLWLLLPEKAWEGQGVLPGAAVVKLGGTTLADLVVSLASSDTSELIVPDSVTVHAGQSTAAFNLTVVDDAGKDGAQTVTVSASAGGFPPAASTISIGDNEVDRFAFAPIASPQYGSAPFAVTITAVDVNGQRIDVYEAPIELTAVGDSGPLSVATSAKIDTPAIGEEARTVDPAALVRPSTKGLGLYHDYATLTAELAVYAAAHQDICRLTTLGQSVEGRELWALKISDNPDQEENEPESKLIGSIHGDEPVGVEMCLWLIDALLGGYGADPAITSLVNGTELWIVPTMNPDGREAGTRENAAGADLNRSFPDGSLAAIGNVYHGPAMDTAGLPAEVVAMMNWSAARSFTLSGALHGGALVVNYPYDNDGRGAVDSPTPDDALLEHVALTYSSLNGPMYASSVFPQGITNGADWYVVVGGMQDWNYRYLSCNELTIELSNAKWPAASALPDLWNDNRASLLAFLETAQLGVHGLVTDALTGEPLYAEVQVAGNDQPVFSDPQVGDYHRMLLPGTYDLTFSAPGRQTRTLSGVVVPAGGRLALDVALEPGAGGVVISGGQWVGHVAVEALDTGVTLHAIDAQGHAGQSNAFDVVHGALDHFEFTAIPSPQWLGTPTAMTISARDARGYLVDEFSGTVSLSCQTAQSQVIEAFQVPLTPATSGNFVAGMWSGTLTFLAAAPGVVLQASDGAGHSGATNVFNISGSIYDLDGSGRVGTGDYALFSAAWLATPADANWYPAADLDADGLVGASDLALLKARWLQPTSALKKSLVDAVFELKGAGVGDED